MPFIVVITPFITCKGPPCTVSMPLLSHFSCSFWQEDHASGMFPLVPANRSPLEVETRHTAVGHVRGGFIKCLEVTHFMNWFKRKNGIKKKTRLSDYLGSLIIILSPINGGILHNHHRFTIKSMHNKSPRSASLSPKFQTSFGSQDVTNNKGCYCIIHRQNLSSEISERHGENMGFRHVTCWTDKWLIVHDIGFSHNLVSTLGSQALWWLPITFT